jgi:hypothetical protein
MGTKAKEVNNNNNKNQNQTTKSAGDKNTKLKSYQLTNIHKHPLPMNCSNDFYC